MITKKWTAESGLTLLFFGFAIAIRFALLGKNPLSDAEAELALSALSLAKGEAGGIGPQAWYVLFTGGLFSLFEASNFLARLLPALAGSLLAGTPFLFRRVLGRKSALVLAFLLAFDPALIAASRQVNSAILAASFLILGLACLLHNRPAWAGIFGALYLLSGPELWPGMISMLAAGGILSWISYRKGKNPGLIWKPAAIATFNWKAALGWFAGSLVLLGTLFFMVPGGPGAAATSLPIYLSGWWIRSDLSMQVMLTGILAYEFLGLMAGVWGAFALPRQGGILDRLLRIWLLAGLALVFLYPGRKQFDLVWVMIPLLTLAARQIDVWLDEKTDALWVALGLAVAVVALAILVWQNLTGLSNPVLSSIDQQLRWIRLAASLAVIAILVLLVGWGWSVSAAKAGFKWGVLCVVFVFTLAAGWHAAGLGAHPEAEIWRMGAYLRDADLIQESIEELSLQQTGERTGLELRIWGVTSPGLRWLLREQRNIEFVDYLAAGAQPTVVITSDEAEIGLAASYSGQDFVLYQEPAWSLMLRPEWLKWITFREALLTENRILLWARADLFPMGIENTQVE